MYNLFDGLARVGKGLASSGILQKSGVHGYGRQMHVPHDGASNEQVSHRRQMRELVLLHGGHVFQLDVHELIHRLENASDLQVVFELC